MLAAWQTLVGARPNRRREMAHLDKDAAGRLLERINDYTPREMIVRTKYRSTEPGLQIISITSLDLR